MHPNGVNDDDDDVMRQKIKKLSFHARKSNIKINDE